MSKLNKLGTTQAAVPPPITSKVMMNHKKETKSKSAVKSSAEAEDTPVFNRSHVCTQLHVGEHMAMNSTNYAVCGRLGGWDKEAILSAAAHG